MDIAKLFSLEGKVALVTGGSRGIGNMIAQGLLAAGAKVYICARKAGEVAEAVERLGGGERCHGLVADLSQQADIERLVSEIEARDDRLHILVNNAGATWGASIDSYPRDKFDKVMNVNVTAPFALTQRCLKLLRAAATAEDPARVINVSSMDGLDPPRWETYAYGASKAAVLMLTRHMAGRLAPENITVNAIAPGLFPSKMTAFLFEGDEDPVADFDIPLGRAGNIQDMAGPAIFLCSRAGAFLTGVTLPVSGGTGVTHLIEVSQ